MITHIAGMPGSGKTFIKNFLELLYDNIIFIDVDDLYQNFMEKYDTSQPDWFSSREYIAFLRNIITQRAKTGKEVVIVGITQYITKRGIVAFDIGAQRRIYLDIPADTLFQQYNTRALNYVCSNMEYVKKEIEQFMLPMFLYKKEIEMTNKHLKKKYQKLGYKLKSQKSFIREFVKSHPI